MLESLVQWAMQVVYYFGYSGVAVLILLSNLFLPVPSELVLPFAGFLVGQGFFLFPLLMLAATAGSMAGAFIVYAPARRLGEEPVRRFVKRYGRFGLLSESDFDKASGWFDQHGGEAVLIGRPRSWRGRPDLGARRHRTDAALEVPDLHYHRQRYLERYLHRPRLGSRFPVGPRPPVHAGHRVCGAGHTGRDDSPVLVAPIEDARQVVLQAR